jgi:hypothetical protein
MWQTLQTGWGALALWLLVAVALSMAGGALAAMRLAGRDLGNELAALMGAMFGPVAAVPAVLAGLLLHRFV